jgi:hypothetical protein
MMVAPYFRQNPIKQLFIFIEILEKEGEGGDGLYYHVRGMHHGP